MSKVQSEAVLIVDDIPENRKVLRDLLKEEGYRILVAENGNNALKRAVLASPSLILLDIVMPEMDGYEVCQRLKQNADTADIPVIFITVKDDQENLVKSFSVGAVDYITKPFHSSEVLVRVKTHLEINRLTRELYHNNQDLEKQATELKAANEQLKQEIALRQKAEAEREQAFSDRQRASEQLSLVAQLNKVGFIGQSEVIKTNLMEPIQRLNANDKIPVLITGESGTGKELITRAIRLGGARASGPFIAVNCAALPEGLVESALFGHARGAFTGATQNQRGQFEAASGGTIFLDEIGDMKLDVQAKILRVLQEKEVNRVGDSVPIKVDVRVIAATNKDLPALVASGKFREDLYFRLAAFPITVPPLRERQEDIPLLVLHVLEKFAPEMDIKKTAISPEALSVLKGYHFPGNVRELENIIQRALTLSGGDEIRPEHLKLQEPHTPLPNEPEVNPPTQLPKNLSPSDSVNAFLTQCCSIVPYASTPKHRLLDRYKSFCEVEKYEIASRNEFYRRIKELYPQIEDALITKKRVKGFKGLKLKERQRGFESF